MNAFAGGIDGGEGLGKLTFSRLSGLDARVNHLEIAVVAFTCLTVEANGAAEGELLLDGRKIMNEADREAARAVVDNCVELLAAGCAHEALVRNPAFDLNVSIRRDRADGRDARLVFIAKREVEHKVPVAHESELLEPDVERIELSGPYDARGPCLGFRFGGHDPAI